jgi:hypothetical protein
MSCQKTHSTADERPQRVGGLRNERAILNGSANLKNSRLHGCA